MMSRGAADFPHSFLLLCLRVPKSGSRSLQAALESAYPLTRSFYLPNTLDLDGQLSRLQRVRFRRAQLRNLLRGYGTLSVDGALRVINRHAMPGDLLSGGHIDFRSVFRCLTRELKIITILRNPYDRCRSDYYYGRRNYLRKSALARFDSGAIQRVAASRGFESFLDFLLDHRHIYGDIAATYLGLAPWCDIRKFFGRHVFHAGVLERCEHFAQVLGEKMGAQVDFPHLNDSGSAHHVPLPASAKRKIERLYPRDFEVYEYLLAENREQVSGRIRNRRTATARHSRQ